MSIANTKRIRRARGPEVDAEILAWFEGRGPAPNSVKYFMFDSELRELWKHRAQMCPSAEAQFRRIASTVGLDLDD